MSEVEWASGTDRRFDDATARLKKELKDPAEAGARRLVELMAVALQASLILRYSPPEVADAFCASRLEADRGRAYGTLPSGVDAASIVERHRPRLRGG
jgi:putative acyl-CoA dehydrogenase